MTLVIWMIIEASVLFCCSTSADKKTEKDQIRAANDLPNMTISFLDGSQMHAKKLEGNTIIILFFPDCDHCQREATQIQNNLGRFKNYTLYFVATTPKQEIEKFAMDYKLKNYKNVRFGTITVQEVLSNFGSVATPSLYIYSSEHKLVQTFNGETDIQTILKYIK